MKPHIHAINSARRHGGRPEDYQNIHDFFDSSKACVPDIRHRALLHSSFGIFMVERVFGPTMRNSDGRLVSVRDLGEEHVMDDLGFIPTVEKWLQNIPIADWMWGARRGKTLKHIDFTEPASGNDD